MLKPSFGKLRTSTKHFGASSPGTPYISDGDTARVLFFFNLSGAYNGNARLQEAVDDARIIVSRVNSHAALVEALEACEAELAAYADYRPMDDDAAKVLEQVAAVLKLAKES